MLPILMDRLDHVSSQYYYFMGTGVALGVSVLFYNGILLDKFQDAKAAHVAAVKLLNMAKDALT